MLPPGLSAEAAMSTPRAAWIGLPRASAQYVVTTPLKNRMNIAAHTAQPCACLLTIHPNVHVSAEEMMRIEYTSRKFVHGVGFSNGCAELTLKKPPPLVPSCLMAIWLAAGPIASVCFAPSSVVAVT